MEVGENKQKVEASKNVLVICLRSDLYSFIVVACFYCFFLCEQRHDFVALKFRFFRGFSAY